MTDAIAQEMLEELFSALEALETQTGTILAFVKDRNLASEEDLAPFREKAASASNVRWRAARVRMNRLLSNEVSQEKSHPSMERRTIDQSSLGHLSNNRIEDHGIGKTRSDSKSEPETMQRAQTRRTASPARRGMATRVPLTRAAVRMSPPARIEFIQNA